MRAVVLGAIVLAGCFSPRPPSGSYTCGAADTDGGAGVCPSSLSCVCGLCVRSATQSACGFDIALPQNAQKATFGEHVPFVVTISALEADGTTPASQFNGEVSLSSSWGDVCVGTKGCLGLPHTVQLENGTAQATIQLNRETSPPQTAVLTASWLGNSSTSNRKITVLSVPATAPASPLVAPLAAPASFGFAQSSIGSPFVVHDGAGWRMYFLGDGQAGVATSPDGITFTAPTAPLFAPTSKSDGFGPVAAYVAGGRTSLFFGQDPSTFVVGSTMVTVGYGQISQTTATTDAGPFAMPPAMLFSADDCAGCESVDYPMVIADPKPALTGGGPSSAVMFFSATQMSKPGASVVVGSATGGTGISILRATATDGTTFVLDPGAALENDFEERVIAAPRVLLDGTVLKMWYSFTVDATTAFNPCSAVYDIGYATSSDGYFWVRSPNNAGAPTLAPGSVPWAGTRIKSLMLGSVVAADGSDPSNGIAFYFTVFGATPPDACTGPNGIGRAVLNLAP